MKYHISEDGNPRVCKASEGNCKFGNNSEHFSTKDEARQAFEKLMNKKDFAIDYVKSLPLEKQQLVAGGVNRVLKDWHSADERAYWTAAYDSTEAGKLYFERKMLEEDYSAKKMNMAVGYSQELETRMTNAENFAKNNLTDFEPSLPADPGLNVFTKEFSTPEELTYDDATTMEALKTKLALLSGEWLAKLTPAEIDSIAWITSNGSTVLNYHISGKEHPTWPHKLYSEEYLDETIQNFRSAMAKAPELDEPIIIYRGTSLRNVVYEELARPASTSAAGQKAKSFRGRVKKEDEATNIPVIIEIKTKKVASVAAMGAWGVSEMEILAPLGKYKKINEFDAVRGIKNRHYGKDIEPDLDTVRIVQLAYLG